MTDFHHLIDAELLARYLAGASTAEEQTAVEAWSAAAPDRAALIGALRTATLTGDASPTAGDANAVWAELTARLDWSDATPTTLPPRAVSRGRRERSVPGPTPSWTGVGVRIAAAIATVLVLIVGVRLMRGPHADAGAMVSYVTRDGQRRAITLPDGTVATLAPASTMRVEGRVVTLDGEAHFVAARRPDELLIVHARGTITRVLGTTFDVRAYRDDPHVRLVVTEGRVAFARSHTTSRTAAIVGQGDVAEATPTGILIREGDDPSAYLQWMRGRLVLNNVPLTEAVVELRRWYGLDVVVGRPELAQRRIDATLKDGSVDEILALVTVPLHLRYERRGTQIVLLPR